MENELAKRFKVYKSAPGEITFAPAEGSHDHTLIWLHGVGDTAAGYIAFFYSLDSPVPPRWKVRAPTADLIALKAFGGQKTHSWFDVYEFTGKDGSHSKTDMDSTADRIEKMIEEEAALLGGDYSKIFLGGFSQGCMLSLYVIMRRGCRQFQERQPPAKLLGGVLGMSGVLFSYIPLPPQEYHPPILIVHGTADQMVPFEATMMAYSREGFQERENVVVVEIEGMDHSIWPQAIRLMRQFFNKFS